MYYGLSTPFPSICARTLSLSCPSCGSKNALAAFTPLGPKRNIEIYYESDIPFPPTFANNMIKEQKLDTEVVFLQKVRL